MSRLAKKLDIGVMSMYWYFRNKDDLLDALSDEAARRFAELLPDLSGYPWDEHLREYFRAFRRIYREQPVLRDLIIMRAPMQYRSHEALHSYFERLEREIAVLVDAGFTIDAAARAYAVLSIYARGCLINERLFADSGQERNSAEYNAALGQIDFAGMPYLAKVHGVWDPEVAMEGEFEHGLGLIIEGLRSMLEQTAKAPGT